MKRTRPRLYNAAVIHIAFIVAAFFLLLVPVAWAETDTIEVMHLPLEEAVAAARSQLSVKGRIAQLPSRRLLIITDELVYIEKARELLRQLDRAPAQLSVQVEISEQAQSNASGVSVSQLVLPGGWIRINAHSDSQRSQKSRQFMLRTSSGATGHIEAGEIRAVQQSVRRYLTAHGIVLESAVEMLDVTAGFDVQATLLAADEVHLRIRPWLRDSAANAGNTQAAAQDGGRIMVAEASTELTVKLDEQVTLAANDSAANEFSTVLLGVHALNSRDELTISVTISKAGM